MLDRAAQRVRGSAAAGARRRVAVVATAMLGASAVVAACTPPPGPPADPSPPVITRFFANTERSESPVLAALGWTISDPNGDVLTCRVDTDGDGTFDREITGCRSVDTLLAEFTGAGERTLTLEVSDGEFDPVTATTTVAVTDGPAEDYEITLRIDPGMREEFREAFQLAAERWEEVIVAGVSDEFLDLSFNPFGFPPFTGVVDDVLIDARDITFDGPGGTLGRAGGFAIREDDFQPYYGIMEFDTADLDQLEASGRLREVILHEMGHVLGLGPSWLLTGKLTGVPLDPHYTGPAAVAAYQELGGNRYVPVENEGGLGTVFGHWREATFGNELMTGYLNQGLQPMSRMTIAALADLGYGVDLSAADPYSIPALAALSSDDEHEHLHSEPIEPGIVGPSN